MLVSVNAIVVHSFPYGDNSMIVKCYTNTFGLKSYLINGVKNKKGPVKPGMLFPLTLLNLVAYHKDKGGLERIKEAHLDHTYITIPYDPFRNALTLFLGEVLLKVLHEDEVNEELFDFIKKTALHLDETNDLKFFHLRFLLDLMFYLGFRPSLNNTQTGVFDMLDGQFVTTAPTHPYFIPKEETSLLLQLLKHDEGKCSKVTRLNLLQHLLEYYKLQIDSFGEIKSLDVIKELF